MSLERQVRIAAGLVVFFSVMTGVLMHPAGYWIAGAVGAGLAFSGFANLCGLSSLLAKMPWNRTGARGTAGVQG
jgi:hypothetical protein